MKKILPISFLFAMMLSKSPTAQTSSQIISTQQIGSSGNQLTSAFGPYTNLWYDGDIQTLLFVHRSNSFAGWPTNSFILCDYSTDYGLTWQSDQGPAFEDSSNLYRAKYPQGAIYNPPGNTDPANAVFTAFGPADDGATWRGFFSGTVPVASTIPAQLTYQYPSVNGSASIPKSGLIVKNTRITWWSAPLYLNGAYADSITIARGEYNSSTGAFDYILRNISVPVKTTNNGTKMFVEQSVVFNDEGNLGYLIVAGNDWVNTSNFPDSAFGLIIYQTLDSGATWNRTTEVQMHGLDSLLLNNGSSYQPGFTMDLGMDRDDKVYAFIAVLRHLSNNSVSTASGEWALFSVSSINGLAWDGCLIARPHCFAGTFGFGSTITEYNRQQFSRSWDGSKIFYTWFDTDTSLFGSGFGNVFPDMHSIGYDLDQNLWSQEENFTVFSGTNADGETTFGNVCYYTIDIGVGQSIPVVFNNANSDIMDPVYFYYLGGASISNYALPGTCFQLADYIQTDAESSGTMIGLYPNPAETVVTLDIDVLESSNAEIVLWSPQGMVIKKKTHYVHPGKNKFQESLEGVKPGLYLFRVTTPDGCYIRKLVIGKSN